MSDFLRGSLVRLGAMNPAMDADLFAQWSHDSEYLRLLDNDPARPMTAREFKEEMEEAPKDNHFPFMIHTLEPDRTIGFVGLWVNWINGDGWIGIGIGEPDYRGKGYGTDAMRVLLRFAFTELNLHRVSLGLFAYNERALHSYEKVGFVLEGRTREDVHRDGQRSDSLWMGILKREWEEKQKDN